MRAYSALVAAAAWLLASGCSQSPAGEPLIVEFAGCASVGPGPRCALAWPAPEPGRSAVVELTVWAALPVDTEASFAVDGETSAPVQRSAVDAGLRFRVPIAHGASQLTLRVANREPWELTLLARDPVPVVERARTLRREGKSEDAETLLSAALGTLSGPQKADALSFLGRLALGQGHAEAAVSRLRRSSRTQRQNGCLSCAFNDAMVLAFTLIHNSRDFEAARQVFAAVPDATDYPEAGVHQPYYEGLLATESGDLRAALRLFAQSRRAAERLNLSAQLRAARQMQARTLQILGRLDEASELVVALQRESSSGTSACQQAALLNDVGWISLLAREARAETGWSAPEVAESLGKALDLYETTCQLSAGKSNTLLNLAMWALQGGDLSAARVYLERARKELPEPQLRLRLWQLDLQGRIALRASRFREALTRFDELVSLAQGTNTLEAQWRAEQGRAGAFAQMGRFEDSLAAFELGERLLDREAELVPLGEGRDVFLGARIRGTQAHIALLLAQGHTARAAKVARRARSRALMTMSRFDRVTRMPAGERVQWDEAIATYRRLRSELDAAASDQWQLPASELAARHKQKRTVLARADAALDRAFQVLHGSDKGRQSELSSPADKEVYLLFHPQPDGWWLFAIEAQRVTAHALEAIDVGGSAEELGEKLLKPVADVVRRVDSVRVISSGVMQKVDFHALVLDGQLLLERVPVAYAVDLPDFQRQRVQNTARRATVVADPEGNLAAARIEAREVAALLSEQQWQVRRIEEGLSADKLRTTLQESRLFHYAGHGVFGGTAGWQSALPLSSSLRLELGDILALPRAPEVVVLAGCETGRTNAQRAVAGLGLAQAFVVSGAQTSIAATRTVRDDLARDSSRNFYRALANTGDDPVAALRLAQLSLRKTHPNSDWTAFRAYVP